jgi:hypothetical protein
MNFTNEFISCAFSINGMNVNIKGTLNNASIYKKKFVIAPTPSNKITSYSGSSLPYPNEEIAFQNTKNLYEIKDSFSGKPLFEVREERTSIDFTKQFNDISNV